MHGSGWPLAIVGNRDGATMVFVPGGTFTMGNDDGPPTESPVAQGQALALLHRSARGDRPPVPALPQGNALPRPASAQAGPRTSSKIPSESSPMVMVNARDAQAYADWAHKQLPTEAQWEMAARATDGRLFPWGPSRSRTPSPAGDRDRLEPVDVVPRGCLSLRRLTTWRATSWNGPRTGTTRSTTTSSSASRVDNPTGPAAKPRSLRARGQGRSARTAALQSARGSALDKRLTYVGFRCVLPVQEQAEPDQSGARCSRAVSAGRLPPGQPANPPAGQDRVGRQFLSEPPEPRADPAPAGGIGSWGTPRRLVFPEPADRSARWLSR